MVFLITHLTHVHLLLLHLSRQVSTLCPGPGSVKWVGSRGLFTKGMTFELGMPCEPLSTKSVPLGWPRPSPAPHRLQGTLWLLSVISTAHYTLSTVSFHIWYCICILQYCCEYGRKIIPTLQRRLLSHRRYVASLVLSGPELRIKSSAFDSPDVIKNPLSQRVESRTKRPCWRKLT